jgi:hypothetical protein
MTEYDPKLARFILGRLEKVAKVQMLASTAGVWVDPVHPAHEKIEQAGQDAKPV